ncbi:hypothetical protein U2150_02915 [Methanothermobacter wolfeii]|uniref:Uncharacterized protein n=1 Tax=Methanothermobacter wolfeii TaxID=145261 RepID=A0ABU8TVF2_METWO
MFKFEKFTTSDLAFTGLIIALMYIVQTITIWVYPHSPCRCP